MGFDRGKTCLVRCLEERVRVLEARSDFAKHERFLLYETNSALELVKKIYGVLNPMHIYEMNERPQVPHSAQRWVRFASTISDKDFEKLQLPRVARTILKALPNVSILVHYPLDSSTQCHLINCNSLPNIATKLPMHRLSGSRS